MNIFLKFPEAKAHLQDTFQRMCQNVSPEQIDDVRSELQEAAARLNKHKDEFLGPNIELVRALTTACTLLLDKYETFTNEERALVIGAVRYFVLSLDTFPDTTPISGLDDDVLIVNSVFEYLGLGKDKIKSPNPIQVE